MHSPSIKRFSAVTLVTLLTLQTQSLTAAPPPLVTEVDWQPLQAQVRRLVQATDYLGIPLSNTTRDDLQAALKQEGPAAIKRVQEILDPYCLVDIQINPEMRVKAQPGPARPELDEKGWRQFLVKVRNEAGTTAPLKASSPNARPVPGAQQNQMADRWLDLMTYDKQPLTKNLTGLSLEYRILQLYSRDHGKREARLLFDVGQGTQDLGFRSEIDLLFTCQPAHSITLEVLDDLGKPTTAAFEIRDAQGRVYPSQAKRLAPDFAFHPQIYRMDGEILRLPKGTYNVHLSRGPESLPQSRTLAVDGDRKERFQTRRWIDPAAAGWWSGDHHIHAAGCMHYEKPTEGVLAIDMIRHCIGEDLKIGANLTWGPGFDYQKQFFCGKVDEVSKYPYLLRYDIEVSGFGSHRSGHLCLLRLKEQMYPGGDSKDHWPTLCLNTLRWAKKQGALAGPAHSGWGLQVDTGELPNYIVPPFDGIGANEYIVDVTHQVPGPGNTPVPAVDFLSMVDTPSVWELNIWYHTLNVGFRTRISGETDFPCIYGERVGLGRSYVKLQGPLDYDSWCEGIRAGRNYVSDGKSHIIDFKANETAMGENDGELRLPKADTIKVTAQVAARLNETPDPALQKRHYSQKPYWDVERARINDSRKVPVELLVNGYPVARQEIEANGELRGISFDVPIEKSSWIALRILPSSHTNPIFVLVDGKPIRASRRSAEWCLKGVDQCWSQKEKLIDPGELDDARNAYDHARETYRRLIAESN